MGQQHDLIEAAMEKYRDAMRNAVSYNGQILHDVVKTIVSECRQHRLQSDRIVRDLIHFWVSGYRDDKTWEKWERLSVEKAGITPEMDVLSRLRACISD